MMDSLNYCNSKGICHRDLKPQNFLLVDKKEEATLKLIDFGLSQVYSRPGIGKICMSASVGTVTIVA